jgi:hypothetical protein
MKIEARFRRRANILESVDDLNCEIISRLSKIDGLWGIEKEIFDVQLNNGRGESAAIDISMCLQLGMRGAISYASRLSKSIFDKAIYDDTLFIQMNTDSIEYKSFSRKSFPEIIKAFGAYRASIVTDLDQDLDDFEDIIEEAQRTNKDVDGRDTVFRIYPVNYFDDLLCGRALELAANQVVEKLMGSIVLAENFQSGVLIIASDEPLVGTELVALNGKIRGLLKL